MRLELRDNGRTLAVGDLAPIERALLLAGSELAAIRTARRIYQCDQPTARTLVRAVRNGTCTACGEQACLGTCTPQEADHA
jgi:hypothetical protein